jgi:GNAT superfamily N-acetyltransferase
MNPERYEIVNYDQRFKEAVLELQTLLWNPSHAVNAAHLGWKYHQNPYAPTPHIYLALHHGHVVGMRGFYGSKWEGGTPAEVQIMLCAGDVVIAPEHRGVGLPTRIMEHALADLASVNVPFLLSLSGGKATRRGSLSMGWDSLGPITIMRREHRATRTQTLWRRLHRVPNDSGAEKPFSRLDRFLGQRDGQVQLRKGMYLSRAPRPEEMAALVTRVGHDGRVRHVRDETYFSWRFQKPLSTYRFLYLGRSHLEAYLVLQIPAYEATGRPIYIVDFEAETDAAAMQLLDAGLELGELNGVTIWSPSLSLSRQDLLGRRGFVTYGTQSPADDFPTILVRPAARTVPDRPWLMGGRNLSDPGSWDLRYLYSDGC